MTRQDGPGRAVAAIEQHRATLLAEAIDIQRQYPGIRLVGMVIEPDAPEADALRPMLPPEVRDQVQRFVGTMERAIALKILGASAPAVLDWLEDDHVGLVWKLPVVYAAKTGVRAASIPYDTEE
jgi:hypothetical protein